MFGFRAIYALRARIRHVDVLVVSCVLAVVFVAAGSRPCVGRAVEEVFAFSVEESRRSPLASRGVDRAVGLGVVVAYLDRHGRGARCVGHVDMWATDSSDGIVPVVVVVRKEANG